MDVIPYSDAIGVHCFFRPRRQITVLQTVMPSRREPFIMNATEVQMVPG